MKTEGFFWTEGILSRIFETAATARRQVGVMMVHERAQTSRRLNFSNRRAVESDKRSYELRMIE